MKKSKKLISLLLVTVMTASLAVGCGQGTKKSDEKNTTDGKGTTSEEKGSTADADWDTSKNDTITLSVINNFYTAGEKKLAEEYMKLHPETKVVVDVVSDNDAYKAKMMTSLDGDRKNAPDIVHGNFVGMALTNNSMDLTVEKGYIYDMTEMLDEENPYNGGKVRDAFLEEDLQLVLSEAGGRYTPWLPFDKIGFALFYNKDLLDKAGIEPPKTWEDLQVACEKLKKAGYDVPISAGPESFRLANTIADAVYRSTTSDILTQPGDALWDENKMAANKDFKFDESNTLCDQFTVFNVEREMKYATENGISTDTNKKIFNEFYKVAKYFPDNWIAADSTQAIADFEGQVCPMLYQASFNAGMIMNDIKDLPEDMRFNWGTSQISQFKNAPEGFGQSLRGYWDFGNVMSIINSDDKDHLARVKDFYKYWYSAKGAKTCYEETLNNGNFVQGPSIIKGVTLSEELEGLLAGFKSAPSKEWAWATGMQWSTSADTPKYYDYMNQFTSGKISVDKYLKNMETIYQNYNKESIDRAGFDLDPTTADQAKE